MLIRFAYPLVMYSLFPLILCLWFARKRLKRELWYSYSLAQIIKREIVGTKAYYKRWFTFFRLISLAALIVLMARPQLVDQQSTVKVDGVDIVLALDVSGSMQLFDDPKDQKQRITIAKEEAIHFVRKRLNDPIGLVLFGKEAISRCPLTLDKKIIESIIKEVELGIIDPSGTVIAKGLITALNRLRTSVARSKIIILLTDGEPSPEDLSIDDALFLAKKYGVKIYTIGIGGQYGGLYYDQFFGQLQQAGVAINTKLLQLIAEKTGGRFFLASNQKDLQEVYNVIDALEKTDYETNVYHHYYDIGAPWIWFVVVVLLIELCLASFVWYGL